MPARLSGSFRDPAGHIFVSGEVVYRRIEPAGRQAYERLMQSGLYEALVAEGLLVAHEDLGPQPEQPGAWTVIRPEQVQMVSYPYEWCFSQLRDAARLTLGVQRRALEFGLSLKDASAYNVQFLRGRPVLIDTLSFEPHRGGPWVAYRQFCQHFYAPLLLASAADPRLPRLSQIFVDGVPLSLASKLLPKRTWLRPGPLMHVHLHAKAEARLAGGEPSGALSHQQRRSAAGRSMTPLLESLDRAIAGLRWEPRSDWASYYADRPSYDQETFDRKRGVVSAWLQNLHPATVWDLGGNTGQFSTMAAELGAATTAFDADPACVEVIYRGVRSQREERLLPLVADLANPSPAIGWGNAERMTLEQRGPADLVLALALIHHLAIGNNVPFESIADYIARIARRLIIEFVPASDPMVQSMMTGREEVFADYTVDHFERAFRRRFTCEETVPLGASGRVLYLMSVAR
jgi:SAM-dependent methyltransferase